MGRFELRGLVSIAPRRTDDPLVPLCAEHARTVADEISRQVLAALEGVGADPNRNRSNRAMSSEDLGDAEE